MFTAMNSLARRPASYRPVTITEGLRTSARRTPNKLAFTQEGREITHGQLIARINKVSNLGLGLGLQHGDRAALMSRNCIEYMEITCGLSEIGVAPAMINSGSIAAELAYVCNDSGARVLFVHADLVERVRDAVPETVERIIVFDPGNSDSDYERLLAQAADTAPQVPLEEWDVFSIPYTSGTTGKPKGVLLSHRSRVNHMLFAMAANYGCYTPEARPLANSPFHTGAGFINGLAGSFFGGTTHILEKYEPELMLRAVTERRITSMFMVPTHFHAMFNLGSGNLAKYDVSSLKAIHSNAAPLPQATKEIIVDYFGTNVLFESYGSTECGSVTSLRPEDQLRKIQCVGPPGPGVWLEIRDEKGAVQPPDQVGEVWVKNSWLFNGYWNMPEATAEALVEGWCTVGDLGRVDEEGFMYLVDRKKNMIISGGQNIFPREIEEVLHHHSTVAEAAVVGRRDDYWGEAVTAFVVLRPDQSATEDDLKTHCAEGLARYKLPKTFYFIDAMPKNAAGKILHRDLREALNRGEYDT